MQNQYFQRNKSNLISLLTIAFFILFSIQTFGQIENDIKWRQHWENKPNSLIFEYNTNKSLGLVINGLTMCKNDGLLLSFIKKITGFHLDTNAFNKNLDTTMLDNLNDSLISFFSRNVVINDSIMNFYLFQYLPFETDTGDYLLISVKKVVLKNENLANTDFCNKFNKEIEMYSLVYSRIFLRKPLDYSEKSNSYFYLLYDVKHSKIVLLEN
jgi:hypothetical protein